MKNTKLKYNAKPVGVAVLGDPQKRKTKFIANPVGAGLVPAQNEKGITLIALIITIIVMLILVGVTINVALNGGLFKKADDAASKTQKELEKEELLSAVVSAYDTNSLGLNADQLENEVKALREGYSVVTKQTSDNKMLVQAPSGKQYTIDLGSSKVEEKPGGNTGDNPEPALKTEYTFTIGDLLLKNYSARDGVFLFSAEDFWPEDISEELKNSGFRNEKMDKHSDLYPEFMVTYNMTCLDSKFSNYWDVESTSAPPNVYYIVSATDPNSGMRMIMFVILDENGKTIYGDNVNQYKDLTFTISMP